jgi:hypothetical protein
MIKMEEQKKEIEELIDLGKEMSNRLFKVDFNENPVSEENRKSYHFFLDHYQQWYSKAYAVIKVILPDRLNDFTILYKIEKRGNVAAENYCISDALIALSGPGFQPKSAAWSVRQQVGILRSCLDSFDSRLFDIQTTLQADLFDSEIDAAKHLQKRGFLRASGAICGVVIEKHLSQVCLQRGVTLRKSNPCIADYNDALKDNAYDTINWRKIQHLGDLRNLCDHNKDREPTKEEVTELISGTEWLTKSIF